MTDRSMSPCHQLSGLVYQVLSTAPEIRLTQLDVRHKPHINTHTHAYKHLVTGFPVKQSEHEGPKDRKQTERGEECKILETDKVRQEGSGSTGNRNKT